MSESKVDIKVCESAIKVFRTDLRECRAENEVIKKELAALVKELNEYKDLVSREKE